MPLQAILHNTYYIFDSLGTALSWNAGSRIRQVRVLAYSTAAALEWQVIAGTPWLRWNYFTNGTILSNSASTSYVALDVIPMGGVGMPAALIPTTMTACSAWIDFA